MDHSGAVGLDESLSGPSPSPLPQPRSRSPRDLFYGGSLQETEEELETAAAGDAGSSTGDQWTPEPSDGWSDDDPSSSPASSPEKPLQLLSKAQMRQTSRAAVKIGSGMAHTVAAKTEAQQLVGLYLADDEDAANIGDPLADIAYRRGDVVGGKLSPDANDLLRSAMGIAGFFAKQVAKIGEVRRIEAGQAAGEVQAFPTEGVA
jgi:hypothetical protein